MDRGRCSFVQFSKGELLLAKEDSFLSEWGNTHRFTAHDFSLVGLGVNGICIYELRRPLGGVDFGQVFLGVKTEVRVVRGSPD